MPHNPGVPTIESTQCPKETLTLSGNPKKRGELLVARLADYDFQSKLRQFNELRPPVTGIVVEAQKVLSSSLYTDEIIALEEQIKQKPVVILSGAFRMGKSSILNAWERKNPKLKRGGDDLYGTDLDDETVNFLSEDYDEIFLDEFSPTQQSIQHVDKLILKGKRVILSTDLISLPRLEKTLQAANVNFGQVIISLCDESELTRYVSKILELPEDDKLARIVASLSGGCPFVANIICSNIINTAYDYLNEEKTDNTGFIKRVINLSKDQISSHFISWSEQRAQTDPVYHPYIPNPLLEHIQPDNAQLE
ncbi:hypothetical protein B5M47_03200 [candidate division CPR3 bacterium 4484_211]|uniref:Uncharacterized protein n=1 Tax=candidate division CPR3 bacterium 4484_211 TaxID=1968527 RepID=A0A1W9NXH8_UNCC3|nr:MAG: hypothetical protein B5M47_03200 [candidate division CPR3 bacterium 4484_211]